MNMIILHAVVNHSFTLTYNIPFAEHRKIFQDYFQILSVTNIDSINILIHAFWRIYACIIIRCISKTKITG